METLRDLLIDELKDVYDAEHQIVKALPKMVKAAENDKLQKAFEDHLEETKGQIERLEKCFKALDVKAARVKCDGMAGLLEEGESILEEDLDPMVKDAALIAAAQRVEHYEMAAYGSLRSWAQFLGEGEVVNLLTETLDEEGAADDKLTRIAEKAVNKDAARVDA